MNQLDAFVTTPAQREAFIQAMRTVASSVTVVTTDGAAGRHGATVSAFCSVSADPPSALVCLNAASRIARSVAANGIFCVNVLPQPRRDIADRFAGRHDAHVSDRFDGIEYTQTSGLPPAISGATVFFCALEESIGFGTHRIFIGHVVDLRQGGSDPLTYLNGAYHRVVPKPARADPVHLHCPALIPADGTVCDRTI